MANAAAARHMSSVEDYRARLATLQGAWDTLALLSHLSGDATELRGTRQAFETLAGDLVRHLTAETYRKTLLALRAKSQIGIDVMVRNLYERTADIGFLSTDADVRHYLLQIERAGTQSTAADELSGARERLRQRFREYVAKYSVYEDVILLSPKGEVLLRLDTQQAVANSRDPLIAEALATRAGYVETFRGCDLLPQQQRSLVYSFRVCDGSRNIGVLCLCFRFEDEVRGIFQQLREQDDWTVFAFLDAQGTVIASSDPWQLPVGAPMSTDCAQSGRTLRFAGREYLAVTVPPRHFQGYGGPGWYGHAMVPLEHAFDSQAEGVIHDTDKAATAMSEQASIELRHSAVIFSADLRAVPEQADRIQNELNRAVWNGNIRLASRTDANMNFAKVLLWEIGNAGRRTQATFDRSIADLQRTVISAIAQDAKVLAALCAELLERNLYERANDCRWWALNATLLEHLCDSSRDRSELTATLRHINDLYTVYHDIVLFDADRRVVATSNHQHAGWTGRPLHDAWAGQILALRTSQDYLVSEFAPSALYDDRHALIFGAAIRSATGRAMGGLAIVLDTASQLESMLNDSLPRNESGGVVEGCVGMFVDAQLRVLAATSAYSAGDRIELLRDLLGSDGKAVTRIAIHNGSYYAVGTAPANGYREYGSTGIWGVVMIPLGAGCTRPPEIHHARTHAVQRQTTGNEQSLDIATFYSSQQWLGVLRDQVVEAVDGSQRRAIPGSPSWHAGLLMFRDMPIPVIDIARLLDGTAASSGHDVIVTRVPGSNALVGLLVDELGGIPEIAASRVLPMSGITHSHAPAIVDRAIRPENAGDALLCIVNLEHLLLRTQVATASTVLS